MHGKTGFLFSNIINKRIEFELLENIHANYDVIMLFLCGNVFISTARFLVSRIRKRLNQVIHA